MSSAGMENTEADSNKEEFGPIGAWVSISWVRGTVTSSYQL